MRIVAGRFKGRPLQTPRSDAIRPTSDRVRESLFNILQHGIADFSLEGARVLDLFAGTGALGFEAVSRGAASCLFVEEEAEARGLIRANMESLSLTGVTKLFRRDATSLGPAGRLGTFDLVLLDPPYGRGLGEAALTSAISGGWLAAGAIVVLEERADVAVALPAPVALIDRRVYGDTQVVIARLPAPLSTPA
jgi:16S rRNA (guanine966-N2)-methyltransferase